MQPAELVTHTLPLYLSNTALTFARHGGKPVDTRQEEHHICAQPLREDSWGMEKREGMLQVSRVAK
jgi:hypothetical protein